LDVKARRYDVAIKLGGVAGVVAPLVGKAPEDVHVWIVEGMTPAFVRMDGQLFAGKGRRSHAPDPATRAVSVPDYRLRNTIRQEQ
jgi:hypothetical protein